jgi:hypothetical protein
MHAANFTILTALFHGVGTTMPGWGLLIRGSAWEWLGRGSSPRPHPRVLWLLASSPNSISFFMAHNAGLDIALLNAELVPAGKPVIVHQQVMDTLVSARSKYPAGANQA